MRKLKLWIFSVFVVLIINSCFNEYENVGDKKQTEKLILAEGVEIKSEIKNNSFWKPADKIKAKVILKQYFIKISFDFSDLNNELLNGIPFKGDTLSSTVFYLQLKCNGKVMEPNLMKGRFTSLYDSSGTYTSSIVRLKAEMLDKIEIPLYAFKDFPSGSNAQIQVRLWQDRFFGEEEWTKKKVGNFETNVVLRDTLQKKLIDNTYNFNLSVPKIFRTQIVCDSIILQNDSAWNPYGSDNTIWNSSLPDIYFSVADEFWNEQLSSHIEKSTFTFNIPDTLNYFHFEDDAVIRINVYDHDNLSRDDMIGSWKGLLSSFNSRTRYLLKFDHVDKFYMKKIERGLQN